MKRILWVYSRGGVLSFRPGTPRDEPVFGALIHAVGVRVFDDMLVIPRAGPDGFRPAGLILAARCRLFRLRVWLDRLWPEAPDASERFRRYRPRRRRKPQEPARPSVGHGADGSPSRSRRRVTRQARVLA